MATVTKWTPFGVALDVTATGGTVTRTSATQYTVVINASWETYYSGAKTNYGMTAASGGVTKTISAFDGTKRSSGSGSFTGTYSISGNSAATKTVTVTFRNFNTDNSDSATKNVSFSVSVPAWTSYTITYNANGGSGAPGKQTKWKDQTLTLSSTKPTRTGYSFLGWSTSSSATSATYSAGGSYTANAAATLHAVWKANTYTVKYNANGGSGAPGNQTKTYGETLTLSSTKPTRTNYNFKGWGTSASATTVAYAAGASYTANAAVTLYAIWELAYVKPRISNLSIVRCDSSGAASDDGTKALVTFNWSCDLAVSSITIQGKLSTSSTWATATNISVSGTSGTVSTVVGATLSTEYTYDVRVAVSDANGSSYATGSLPSMKFTMDFKSGGNGVAFGKTAELEDTVEFGFKMASTHGELVVTPVELLEGTDLDDVLTAGYYVIGNTTISTTILNKPYWYSETNSTAAIYVIRSGEGAQVIQKYYPCAKTEQFEFQRMYYSGTWSEWMLTGGCTNWRTLTVASGFEVYSSTGTPKYRVNGNLVTVRGVVKPTAATSSSSDVKMAGTIDSQFRPSVNETFICQGSSINRWLLTIKTDGSIYVGRYGTTSYIDIPVGAWLTFTATYSL